MTNPQPKILIILGPTACRKTYFSLLLAEKHNAEIISADSMQIYKHLDIGTAKPTQAERKRIPHHMIDIINPDEYFSAKDFEERADAIIDDISRREKNSIVVGGTGFFIKALTHGLFDLKNEHNSEIRKKLENEETQKLYEELILVDPEKARLLHPHDRFRIIRALEVNKISGVPLSKLQQAHGFKKNNYIYKKLGLVLERKQVYERINARVDEMITAGLEDEVRSLLSMGYGKKDKPLGNFAYSSFIDAHDKFISREDAIEKTKRDTRRFAKRQITWYKKDSEIHWFNADTDEEKILTFGKEFFDGGSSL
jgi:tRNA dimethylallyltransferase